MPRNKLLSDKNAISDTAFLLVDAEGMEALSMRRLCKELGVSSMTLYNYVHNIEDVKREILITGFNMLYVKVYDNLRRMKGERGSGIMAYARAYATALYDFSEEHRNICAYLVGSGRTDFRNDAELRQFYNVLGAFMPSGDNEMKLICRMFDVMLTTMIYEHNSGIQKLEREEVLRSVELFIKKMFT